MLEAHGDDNGRHRLNVIKRVIEKRVIEHKGFGGHRELMVGMLERIGILAFARPGTHYGFVERRRP
jgi:hypothetical protein